MKKMDSSQIDSTQFEVKLKKTEKLFALVYGLILLFLIGSSLVILFNFAPGGPTSPQSDFSGGRTESVVFLVSDQQLSQPVQLFFVLIITVIFAITSVTLKTKRQDSLITNFFQSYHITRLKQFKGALKINDVEFKVEWDSKKSYFRLLHQDKYIANAKPKELYWKLLYLYYKLKPTS